MKKELTRTEELGKALRRGKKLTFNDIWYDYLLDNPSSAISRLKKSGMDIEIEKIDSDGKGLPISRYRINRKKK